MIIAGVMRDGPAGKAGMRVGDIVQALNGAPVIDTRGLLGQIASLQPGQQAVASVLRAGKPADRLLPACMPLRCPPWPAIRPG